MKVTNMMKELSTETIYHITRLVIENDLTPRQVDALVEHEWLHVQYARVYNTKI